MSKTALNKMIISTLLCLLYLEKIKSQCSDPCVCDNYHTTEAANCLCQAGGNNCDCDGTRMCSFWGYCNYCTDISACPPIICSESNYYQNGWSCSPCDAHCLTCTGAGACSLCSSPYVVNSGMCVCSSGTYDSGSACSSCDANCLTCTGPGACSQCASTYMISNGVCVCLAGTYNAGSSCVACNSICITCTSGSYCTSCLTNYYYYSGQVKRFFLPFFSIFSFILSFKLSIFFLPIFKISSFI